MDREAIPPSLLNSPRDTNRLAKASANAIKLKNDPIYAVLWNDYRPWRKIRIIAMDLGLDPYEVWDATKFQRFLRSWMPSVRQNDGSPFSFSHDALVSAIVHRIDRATGGGGTVAFDSTRTGSIADEDRKLTFRIKTLMDEAAESSIIEGAAITRKNAVEMLRADRPPKTKGERMVVNNYLAMQQVKKWTDRPLTVEMLIELQALLTNGTNPDEERGRLRQSGEDVRVWDERDNVPVYTPPPADQLPARLEALCEFANNNHNEADFLHPLVKASILHFMIGYEHPFVDGNGRTARAIFYWYALRHGYTIFEYLAISEIIRKGFAKYPQAYIDTELDQGDLTYFVVYKLRVIEQALDRLSQHLKQEQDRIDRSEAILKVARGINLRQRLLLEHSLRHSGTGYTVKSHANSNGTTLRTARADLQELVKLRLMITSKRGKEAIYHVLPKLAERMRGSKA